MARRIEETGAKVSFTFEGRSIEAREGDSLAAALVAAGERELRDSVVSGQPRGVFCMMGTCFDCLVEVDGETNVQACRTRVAEGMTVARQTGGPVIGE
ncbi:(2Fe-2S)-binding protein [Mangrovicoccus ximenensis]|uniref:(2Fe-2S)-binding protein n=1 Tax=Mangrovicoccus ximenensis TaxID=1911570 RepID=UPI000D37FEF2|nr:(2Fe-2S)-binding protein [Mangrovicoccus ximenensis]